MGNDVKKDEIFLAKGCIKNDARCQKMLYEKYYGLMLAICLRYTDSREEAKDVLQDGFIKIFKNITSFNFKGSLEGWMKRVVINTAIDNFRKNNSIPNTTPIDEVQDISLPEDINQQLNHQDLLEIVQSLPHGYRTIFNLYVIEGYPHNEIAKMLDISEGTSKSQLSKARRLLRKKVQNLLTIKHEN